MVHVVVYGSWPEWVNNNDSFLSVIEVIEPDRVDRDHTMPVFHFLIRMRRFPYLNVKIILLKAFLFKKGVI